MNRKRNVILGRNKSIIVYSEFYFENRKKMRPGNKGRKKKT